MALSPYLSFDGTCREAFGFYEKILGGRIEAMMTFGDTPMGRDMPDAAKGLIIHSRLILGQDVLMGSDAPPDRFVPMQGVHVSYGVTDPAEADRIFAALAEGGAVHMPIAETFWALRFGMLVDRYGTPWMIDCAKPM